MLRSFWLTIEQRVVQSDTTDHESGDETTTRQGTFTAAWNTSKWVTSSSAAASSLGL